MTNPALSLHAPRQPPSPLDLYLVGVALAGLGVLLPLLPEATRVAADADLAFWVLAASVLPAELLRIPLWRLGVVNQVTMSRPFALALVTGWGAPPAMVVFVVASVVSDIVHRKPAVRIPFNAG